MTYHFPKNWRAVDPRTSFEFEFRVKSMFHAISFYSAHHLFLVVNTKCAPKVWKAALVRVLRGDSSWQPSKLRFPLFLQSWKLGQISAKVKTESQRWILTIVNCSSKILNFQNICFHFWNNNGNTIHTVDPLSTKIYYSFCLNNNDFHHNKDQNLFITCIVVAFW